MDFLFSLLTELFVSIFVFCKDAFWALVVFIGDPKFAMHGMLIPGLPKLLALCDFHSTLRKRFMPKLHRHMVGREGGEEGERERGGERQRENKRKGYIREAVYMYNRFQIPCDNINSYCVGKCAVGSDNECRKCIVVQYMC